MRKGEPIKKGPEVIGNKAKVKIVKNKVAVPFKNCEIDLIYGKGFDSEGELATLAIKKDIIHKAGSWFSYKDIKIGQGSETVKAWLSENPEIREEIKNAIRANKEPIIDEETGEVVSW